MGTDMTTFIEIWDDNDKEWRFLMKTVAMRSYATFGRIGGVREDLYGNEEFHNRGLPKNMSPELERKLAKDEYYHSVTYYSGKDLMDKVIGFVIKDEDFGDFTISFDIIMGDYECTGAWDIMMKALLDKLGPTNVRFTFAFDS